MQRIRGYKYRAYPNKSQQEFFAKNFGCCRFVYNHYLEKKRQLWKEWHDALSCNELCHDLTHVLKKEKEWLKEADSAALQQSLRHLDNAYENFFKKRGGYPKFKSKRSAQKYRTPNNKGSIRLDGNAVIIPKAGRVKIVKTRDFDGRIVSATVSKTASGKYYISLQVEEEYELLENNGGQIGLDAGLSSLLTSSDTDVIMNPKTLLRHERRLKCLQRSLSRKQKGSVNREKARRRLAIEHEKVAKSISDASWSDLLRKLEYKMADRGGMLIKVPGTYPSSQRCSCCGAINPKVKDLSVREWTCPECGAEHDRDVNAAINILEKGLEMLASAV